MALVVNGEYLDENRIHEECELIRKRLAQEMPEETPLTIDLKAREWATENAIERVLLRQEAYRTESGHAGVGDSTSAITDERIQKLLTKVTADATKPKRKEVIAFYQKNKQLFAAPESVHVSHIVKNVDEQTSEAQAHEEITKALTELKSGRPFRDVADQYSDCSGSGGELGWFPRGDMVEEFETVVFQLRPGEVSGIFRSIFGFHLATVHERKAAAPRMLQDVYEQVEEVILNQSRQNLIERFLDQLRLQADIRRVPSRHPEATV